MTFDDLVDGFALAGVRPGMVLTVHSSLSSLGHVEGGAPVVVRALHQAVGDQGTILFPMLTFSGSVTKFLRQCSLVDLRSAKVMSGAIPRAAREHPLAKKSIHPTHPVVAIGRAAESLVAGPQSGQGPCGVGSAFYKAAMNGGYIMLIGVTNKSNTTLHCVEELATPYMTGEMSGELFDVGVIDWWGRSHRMQVRGYPVDLLRQFDVINPRLVEQGIMTEQMVGSAQVRLIHGRRMLEAVTQWVKKEPYLLVDRG